ncbi:MAG: flagellar motor protein MotD [Methylococcales bacterium]
MVRRRRRNQDYPNNHDRWIVSYADFVTLLFAFFVVMYAISSVNEGKYKSLTGSLVNAFSEKDQSESVVEPIPIGTPPTVIQPIPLDNPSTVELEKRRELSEEILKERRKLDEMSQQLEQVLDPFIDDKLVAVKKNDYWIELEMNSEMLFLSGEAELAKKALPALQKITEVIKALPNAVNVEGHTDNIPIDTIKFRSNWDLSSARATSVVHELIKNGISPERLSAIGYGEFHPIADNAVDNGRFKNRRVTLVIMSQAFSRYGANDEERAKLLNLVPTATSNSATPQPNQP